MNPQILERFVRDLVESDESSSFSRVVQLERYPERTFRIELHEINERSVREMLDPIIKIATLPAGTQCDCCRGSGKSD